MAMDKVTGLFYYDDYKVQSQRLLKRLDFNCLITTMNIVNFKYINEHYGYEMGDILLRKVATDFYQKSDRYAIGCRIHSDRFAFLGRAESVHQEVLREELENEMKKFASSIAEELGISELRFNAGVYVFKDNDESVSESLDKAEHARKKNLEEYKSWITIYDDVMEKAYNESLDVIAAFQNAIHNKQIKVLLQPVKNVFDNKWEEAEVLARLVGPDGNVILPSSYLQYLDKNGMNSEMVSVVLEKS